MTYNSYSYYSDGVVIEYVANGSLPCSSWMLLPAENLWPKAVRGILYIIAIIYFFLGVAIASDIFMSSIEVITSKKRKVVKWDEEKQEKIEREVLIWNETVANLTLMALGSSAPEILLAVIETASNLGKDTTDDSLGTFTIIGSAAFNLLIITSICIVSVPTPEVKNIAEFGVFIMTSFWSLWAYIWMLLVVQYITPGVIDIWEAWVTLGYMPLFVFLAYCQDSGWWCKKKRVTSEGDAEGEENVRILHNQTRRGSLAGHALPGKELHVLEAEKQQRLSPDDQPVNGEVCNTPESIKTSANISVHLQRLTDHSDVNETNFVSPKLSEKSILVDMKTVSPSNSATNVKEEDESAADRLNKVEKNIKEPQAFARARFRHAIVSAMTGNKKRALSAKRGARFAEVVQKVQNINDAMNKGLMPTDVAQYISRDSDLFGKFTFASDRYAVLESHGVLEVDVLFHRNIPKPGMKVQIVNGDTVAFKNGSNDKTPPATSDKKDAETFTGVVTVEYETREGSAKAGKDFKYTQGFLTFKENEYRKSLSIPIINDNQFENDTDFYIILKNPNNGSGLGDPSVTRVTIVDDDEPGEFLFEQPHVYADLKTGKVTVRVVREHGCDGKVTLEYSTVDGTAVGGKEIGDNIDYVHTEGQLEFTHAETSKNIMINVNKSSKGSKNFIITIKNPSLGAKIGQRSATVCHINKDSIDDRIAAVIDDEEEEEEETWGGQFANALNVGGSQDDDGNDISPKWSDYLLHFLTILWKVIGACVPPTKYLGAWPAFVFSLLYIGALTACVEQLGHLIGCVIGLKTSVTGITIIALGTSLPDTFASRTAAKQDEHADAAIGNVTGSNSVNVFLGLGLPWVLSTMYAVANETEYKVPTGNLTQSVIIFSILGFLCIVVLILRRKFVGGELGGKNLLVKYGTSSLLLLMWCIYILLSSLKAYDILTF